VGCVTEYLNLDYDQFVVGDHRHWKEPGEQYTSNTMNIDLYRGEGPRQARTKHIIVVENITKSIIEVVHRRGASAGIISF